MSPPEIVRGAGGFCRRLVYSRGTCASDRCPTMICAKYRMTRAASGMIHVGHRGFRSVMSHDDVQQWFPVHHWAGGLLDAVVGTGFWATVRTNCARGAACAEPIFRRRLTCTSGLKEDGIVCESQTCRQDTTFNMQLCTHHAPFPQVRHVRGSRRIKTVIF